MLEDDDEEDEEEDDPELDDVPNNELSKELTAAVMAILQ